MQDPDQIGEQHLRVSGGTGYIRLIAKSVLPNTEYRDKP